MDAVESCDEDAVYCSLVAKEDYSRVKDEAVGNAVAVGFLEGKNAAELAKELRMRRDVVYREYDCFKADMRKKYRYEGGELREREMGL